MAGVLGPWAEEIAQTRELEQQVVEHLEALVCWQHAERADVALHRDIGNAALARLMRTRRGNGRARRELRSELELTRQRLLAHRLKDLWQLEAHAVARFAVGARLRHVGRRRSVAEHPEPAKRALALGGLQLLARWRRGRRWRRRWHLAGAAWRARQAGARLAAGRLAVAQPMQPLLADRAAARLHLHLAGEPCQLEVGLDAERLLRLTVGVQLLKRLRAACAVFGGDLAPIRWRR